MIAPQNQPFSSTVLGLGEVLGITLSLEDAPKVARLIREAHARGAADAFPMVADVVAAAVAAEHEACAQVCDGVNRDGNWFAAAIRARGAL